MGFHYILNPPRSHAAVQNTSRTTLLSNVIAFNVTVSKQHITASTNVLFLQIKMDFQTKRVFQSFSKFSIVWKKL